MGVTKQYLRVAPGPVFGVVASQKSNILALPGDASRSVRCAVGACENVYIWDLVKKEKVLSLLGAKSEVSCLAKSPKTDDLAVGYYDGTIRIFSLSTGQSDVTFQGHKSAVTALSYDANGLRLVSGAKDTDVILWDVVSESGLFRLKGHRKEITKVTFLKNRDLLVTSSKDGYIKFWDLGTQHCFYTVVGHRAEVYGFVLLRDETRLVSGSVDSELRVWDIHYLTAEEQEDMKMDTSSGPVAKKRKLEGGLTETDEGQEDDESDDERTEEEKANDEAMRILTCKKVGSVMRQGRERVVCLTSDPEEKLLLCHGTDKHLEVFELPTEEGLNKLRAKRIKKLRKRHLDSGEDVDTASVTIKLQDEIKRLDRFRFSAKLWSVHACYDHNKELRICALLADNRLDIAVLQHANHKAELSEVSSLSQAGHRTEVRALSVSLDNATILSASAEEVKLWNRDSLQCIRTMSCEYALCSLFVTGDRHAVIGTKSGKLQLFDTSQGKLLETVEAHTGAVWSIAPMPDKRGLVSGGADHEVKFWNYELTSDPTQTVQHKVLTLEHTRTLKMDEDVLGVKFSPDHRLLAVALLDNTVKVFFADTLKFFLSLYGHKLPVTSMDISSDSTLIITGSADRNIKIWGLDFGDCHKSIFAHDESVTCVRFVPKTHLFFSGGKDRKVKQWDADNFENILTLEGHHGEVRSLALSPSGNTLVSSSHDRSLRLWEKTEEPLVLEEEREMEREEEESESLLKDGEEVVPGETTEEVKMAGKKTMDTVKGTERIMEALEIYESQIAEQTQAAGGKAPAPHPMMVAYRCETPSDFVLETLRRVKPSDLIGSLLSLPFSFVTKLLPILDELLSGRRNTELVCKCLNFLLKIHHGEITSSRAHIAVVEKLKEHSVTAVQWQRDVTAFNLAGLSFLKKQLEESKSVTLFADATSKRKKKKRAMLAIK
ncbi:WD repeat-containing protein 3 [Aplysia californica]|uniref:WD repeat-containing protein 3 n=1 Tax=Aplysia californica TaxID=6500 RepID=A0ABM0JR13_APLCA|nr:WD repeat-containing protein 3 [Aplysia californica]